MVQAPDLPTVAELGYPGFEVGTWFAIWGPAGVPPAVVARLNPAIVKTAAMADMREQLLAQGLNSIASSADELAAYQRSEQERWGRVVKSANIVAE